MKRELSLLIALLILTAGFCYTSVTFESGNGNINDTINSIVSNAKDLEDDSITLSQFIFNVEKILLADFNSLTSNMSSSELGTAAAQLINISTSSGATYFSRQIFLGSKVGISLSTSSPNWNIWMSINYYNVSQDTLNAAREEGQNLYEEMVASQGEVYANDRKLVLRAGLSSSMQDIADNMIKQVNLLVDAAEEFENGGAYNLALVNAGVQDELDALEKQAVQTEPEKIIDLYHYVFLASPGENSANYWSNAYHINYYKKAYTGAKISIALNTVWAESLQEITYSPNFDASVEWSVWQDVYSDDINRANNDYWASQWQRQIDESVRNMYNELVSMLSSNGLDIANSCVELLNNYADSAESYISGSTSVYDLEMERFETQNDINDLVKEADESERYNITLLVLIAGPGSITYTTTEYPTWKEIFSSGNFKVSANANKAPYEDEYLSLYNSYPDWDAVQADYNRAQTEISEQKETIRLEQLRNSWRESLSKGLPSSVLSDKETAVNLMDEFVQKCYYYANGSIGAYDLELERLFTSFKINLLISETSQAYRDNMTKLVMLDSSSGLNVWDLNYFPTWKNIIESDNLIADVNTAGADSYYVQQLISQESSVIPYVTISMYNMGDVWEELERAGKDFYLRKQDELVREDLQKLKWEAEEGLSSQALAVKEEIVDSIAMITDLTRDYYAGTVGAEELEYETLIMKDRINDLLGTLSDNERKNVLWLIISDAEGFHNIQYGETKWEDTDTDFLISSSNVDTLHYLCSTVNLEAEGPLRIKTVFARKNDEYKRNFFASVDCTNSLNTFKQVSSGCSDEGCSAGEYCYVGDSGSSINYYVFPAVESGAHTVCIWSNTPDTYSGEDRYWDASIYIVNSKPVKDVISLSVVTYDNMHIGVEASAVKKYKAFSYYAGSSEEQTEWDLEMSVRWKELTPEIEQALVAAYEKYSEERAEATLERVSALRADFEQNVNSTLYGLIFEYLSGSITKAELNKQVEGIFSNLSYINSEAVEALGILGNNSFPDNWNKITVNIKNENVNLMIQEVDYLYESSYQPARINYFGDQKAYYAQTIIEESLATTSSASTNIRSISTKQEEYYAEGDKAVMYNEGVSSETFDYTYYGISKSYSVLGFYAQTYVIIKPTPAEIDSEASIIRDKWQNMSSEDASNTVGRINSELSRNQVLRDILSSIGDLSLSLSVEHDNGTIFAVSFSTVGGYVSGISYDVEDGAGNSTDNILVSVQYNAIIEVMNYWEENLKYGGNVFQVIIKVPGFVGLLLDLFTTGQITIQPLSVLLRLTNILELVSNIGKYVAPSELANNI